MKEEGRKEARRSTERRIPRRLQRILLMLIAGHISVRLASHHPDGPCLRGVNPEPNYAHLVEFDLQRQGRQRCLV